MNLNPGFFLAPGDLPIPIPSVPANTPLPPNVINPSPVRPPAPVTSAAIAGQIQRARATGASPFVIARLLEQYRRAVAIEQSTGFTTGVANPNGTGAASGIAPPTTAQNLASFAIMTAPAWLVLGLLHFTKKHAR